MKTKKMPILLIVCIVLAAALVLSVATLASTKSQLKALEEENRTLLEQVRTLHASQSWQVDDFYCSLVVADWAVENNTLSALTFSQAVLPDSAAFDARIELRRGETVVISQAITLVESGTSNLYEVDSTLEFDFPAIGADEELQLWLVVESEETGLLENCAGGWYLENNEWMLVTG